MSIATPALTNFTAGELSPRLEGRVDISRYFNGCRTLENFLVHPHGGAWRRSGFRFMAEALGDGPGLFIPFEFNEEHTYLLELGVVDEGVCMRVFHAGEPVMAEGAEYRLDLPYAPEELAALRYAQSGDHLVVVHPAHPPKTLTCNGAADWLLETMVFKGAPECWKDGNYPSCVAFHEERLVLAATPDRPATIWLTRVGDKTDMRLKTREAPLSDWRDFVCSGTGMGKSGESITVKDGGLFEKGCGFRGRNADDELRYYQYVGGKIFEPDGADRTVTFGTDIEAVHDADGVLDEECWVCCEVGDRVEAPPGEEPLDDDAVEVTLSGRQANGIRFLVSKARLWVGCSGGEWTVSGAGSGEPITPAGVRAAHEGTCGAEQHLPETLDFASLFIQRGGRKVREMAYRFDADAYVSSDLTLLSGHVTGPGVTALACVQEPDPIIFCLRRDGILCALTRHRDQDVTAWSRIVTEALWRRSAAFTHRERGATSCGSSCAGPRAAWSVATWSGWIRSSAAIRRRRFVDSGVTREGDPSNEVEGLAHLAGRTVSVLADGAVHRDVTVSPEGTLKLDLEASVVHAGLGYSSTIRPMRLEAGSARGTAQTKRKRVLNVSVRFYETLGGKVGSTPERLERIHFRTPETSMGEAPQPWSGDRSVPFPRGWQRDDSILVVQDQPLPMTVLLIVPKLVINE
ncbi:hypothetical protein [Salidesulfovibrio brasiliensis]|uniref:hypothetical protein n=1 Tax=Salidesulfovibrio brasiliensis TaxID=221711 RepID=UPI000AFF2178|nr:hypothetical protein [Salidesulfovibrio brasiliensis]